MQTRHAVMFLHKEAPILMWIEGNGFCKEPFTTTYQTRNTITEAGYKHYITHIWIMPNVGPIAETGDKGWSFSPHRNRRNDIMSISAFKQGHARKDLEIIFPQYTAWWGNDSSPGWCHDCSPHDLLITVHYLEQVLGVPVSASPGRTGWEYLKKVRPEWIEQTPDLDLKSCHFDKTATTDIIWQRSLLDTERTGYIHKFDKAAAYPYAASKTTIGVGTPVHKDHGDDAEPNSDKQSVGVWHCTVEYASSYDTSMPPIWKEHRGKTSQGWLSGPIIRLLRTYGHTVNVHEGWVFPESHAAMTKWANSLWGIRQGFESPHWRSEQGANLARTATKQLMNSTIGMTAFAGFEDDDEMKRPDIRIQIIARHRELTYHNIEKTRTLYGVTPVMVYMDALYYISANPDGRALLPDLVKREGQFGGYRYEGRVEITSDVLEIFDTKMGEAERLEYLNKKGWVQ
jgi:hypothetical protein